MGQIPPGMHHCPTRVDGHEVRFAHAVTRELCQSRQRGSYHKCFTCVHNNRLAVEGPGPGPPPAMAPVLARLEPLEARVG